MTQLDLHNECLHQRFAPLIMQQRLAKIIPHICNFSPQARSLAEFFSIQKARQSVQLFSQNQENWQCESTLIVLDTPCLA